MPLYYPNTMFSLMQRREQESVSQRKLFNAATGSQHFVQRLKLDRKLEVHDGCVNTVCWNEDGSLLLSGSDDQHLVISNPFNGKILAKIRSGHRSNIFSAKFLPASMDREVVSCSGSGEIFYTDVDREDTYGANRFDCHFGTTYKIVVVPNEAATFLSCGDDGTVRFFDLRVKTSCTKFNCEEDVVINLRDAVSAMAVDPVIPFQMAVGSADGIVRIYDRRMLKTKESGGSNQSLISRFQSPSCASEKRHYRITSLNYRPGSHDVLVNYSSENIYLFNTYDLDIKQTYPSQPLSMGETSKTTNELNSTRMSGGSTDSEPSTSGAAAAASDNGHDVSGVYKPIKRLRLRGDWSDTGPDARPESEDPAPTNLIMQRMSDFLTRMLSSHGSGRLEEGENSANSSDQLPSESTSGERMPAASSAPPSESSTAAAMLRSVMMTSTGNGARIRPSTGRENTESERYSISSEGLVSPELSSQDYDSTEMSVGQNQVPAREKSDGVTSGASNDSSSLSVAGGSVGSDITKGKTVSDTLKADEPEAMLLEPEMEAGAQSSKMSEVTSSLKNEVHSNSPGPGNKQVQIQTSHDSSHNEKDPEGQTVPGFGEEPTTGKRNTRSENLSSSRRSEKRVDKDLTAHPIQASPRDSCEIPHIGINVLKESASNKIDPMSLSSSEDVHLKDDAGNTNQMQEIERVPTPLGHDQIPYSGSLSSMYLSSGGSQTFENSLTYEDQSLSSDVAIAEENINSSEMTTSQQTLDDVSMMTSCGTISSLSDKTFDVVSQDSEVSDGTLFGSLLDSSPTNSSVNSEGTFQRESLHTQEANVSSAPHQCDIEARHVSPFSVGEMSQIVEYDRLRDQTVIQSSFDIQEFSRAKDGGPCVKEAKDESQATPDVSAKLDQAESSVPLAPFKGKGVGKSSGGKTKDNSHQPSRIYCPYNSGHMKYSVDDDQSDVHMIPEIQEQESFESGTILPGQSSKTDFTQEAQASSPKVTFNEPKEQLSPIEMDLTSETGSTQAALMTPEAVVMNSDVSNQGPSGHGNEESGRQRRTGYSLPPLGSFQLYSDEDEDDNDDEDDAERREMSRRENSDSDRMGRAALKIQELFRKKRAASEAAKLKELPQPRVLMKFAGHRNCRTMIKEANFYGDHYVMSGSDCGRILMWERLTGRLVMYLEADRHVVNCVQPNPVFPLIASSGIDYDIKVWAPLEEDSQFDEDVAEMIIHRNELMLVETRDTITVPAAFMLRVLASLSQIRTGRSSSAGQGQSSQEQSGQE